MPDTDSDYRFRFYERVRIISGRPSLGPVRGELAAVLGRAVEPPDEPVYTVSVHATQTCWCVSESDLEPTGEFDRREAFYDDTQPTLRVSPGGEVLGLNEPGL
jgi:hypothetical protein